MWGKIVKDMFQAPMSLVTRSDVLLQPKQHLTEDGIGNVLACNVFGHYLMVSWEETQEVRLRMSKGVKGRGVEGLEMMVCTLIGIMVY